MEKTCLVLFRCSLLACTAIPETKTMHSATKQKIIFYFQELDSIERGKNNNEKVLFISTESTGIYWLLYKAQMKHTFTL